MTPGSTYATAASIGLNTTYKATTSRKSVTHWYKFTMSKAGMVQLKFAHANLSSTSNSPAWKIDFIADQFGGMVSVNSGLQDTQNQTAKIGLEAGTYYVQVTGRGVLTIGSSDYSFSVQYEDIYCERNKMTPFPQQTIIRNLDRRLQEVFLLLLIPIITRLHRLQKDIFHFSYSMIK